MSPSRANLIWHVWLLVAFICLARCHPSSSQIVSYKRAVSFMERPNPVVPSHSNYDSYNHSIDSGGPFDHSLPRGPWGQLMEAFGSMFKGEKLFKRDYQDFVYHARPDTVSQRLKDVLNTIFGRKLKVTNSQYRSVVAQYRGGVAKGRYYSSYPPQGKPRSARGYSKYTLKRVSWWTRVAELLKALGGSQSKVQKARDVAARYGRTVIH